MALTPINLGAAPNDGSGDNLRTAGSKINANFASIEAALGALPGGASGDGFPTVQAVLSNSTMTYSDGPNQVTAGQIVRAHEQEVRFKVAASSAKDQHVQTAGGVKLYVLPSADGYLPAVAFGYLANNSQSAAAGNYSALHNALLAGAAAGRLVSIPAGTAYTSGGWRYDGLNYKGTGIIGLGARGRSIIRFADKITGAINMFRFEQDVQNWEPIDFSIINVMLDGNHRGNSELSRGILTGWSYRSERLLIEDVDLYNFGQYGSSTCGGVRENAVIFRNCRAWGSFVRHGFNVQGSLFPAFGTPVVFENVSAWDCGGRNLDISRGRAVLRGTIDVSNRTLSEGDGEGNMKWSSEGDGSNYCDLLIADTIISRNSPGHGLTDTGAPPTKAYINRLEISGSARQGLRLDGTGSLTCGTVVLSNNGLGTNDNQRHEIFCTVPWIEIEQLEVSDANIGDGGSTDEAIRFYGPLRYLRIGKLILRNNKGRVLAIAPSSAVPTPATIIDIGYLELYNNNRGNNSSHRIIEVRSSSHPVHMRIRDGIAWDDRSTPRQTRIFGAIASGGRAARIDVDRFVFGAGAQSSSRFSTSGTGASIKVGEQIGISGA